MIDKGFAANKQRMDLLTEKMASIKDGIDGENGKDADEEIIIQKIQ